MSAAATPTGEILSPSQLNTLARGLLEDAFPLVWVEGELGNVSRRSTCPAATTCGIRNV